MSITKRKTPARHAYLFTVPEEQMDNEGKEEKEERGKRKGKVSILIGNKQRNSNKHKKSAVKQKFLNANNISETEKWELTQTSCFKWL